MTTPNYMAQLGATLVDRGFPILPIQPRSKKPGMYRQGAWNGAPRGLALIYTVFGAKFRRLWH